MFSALGGALFASRAQNAALIQQLAQQQYYRRRQEAIDEAEQKFGAAFVDMRGLTPVILRETPIPRVTAR